MKESQLIGNILAEEAEDSKPDYKKIAEQKQKVAASINRSSSAPPVIIPDELPEKVNTLASIPEGISPQDPRLDPNYYTYYYSQRPLDPRLPPPLPPSSWNWQQYQAYLKHNGMSVLGKNEDSSQSASSEAGGSTDDPESFRKGGGLGGGRESSIRVPTSTSIAADAADSSDQPIPTSPTGLKPKSLVEMIQQDFPRTPSPVYNKAPARPAQDPAQSQQLPKRRSSVVSNPSSYYPDATADLQAGMQGLSVHDQNDSYNNDYNDRQMERNDRSMGNNNGNSNNNMNNMNANMGMGMQDRYNNYDDMSNDMQQGGRGGMGGYPNMNAYYQGMGMPQMYPPQFPMGMAMNPMMAMMGYQFPMGGGMGMKENQGRGMGGMGMKGNMANMGNMTPQGFQQMYNNRNPNMMPDFYNQQVGWDDDSRMNMGMMDGRGKGGGMNYNQGGFMGEGV